MNQNNSREQTFRNDIVSLFATFNLGEGIIEREQRILEAVLEISTNHIHQELQKARAEVLKEVETIVVKTKCDYATAINRYMRSNNIAEESIAPDQSELDPPIENKKYCNGEPCTCRPELDHRPDRPLNHERE